MKNKMLNGIKKCNGGPCYVIFIGMCLSCMCICFKKFSSSGELNGRFGFNQFCNGVNTLKMVQND